MDYSMDYSTDWLQQLDQEAWVRRIRQLRQELRQERDDAPSRLQPQRVEPTDIPQRPTRQTRPTALL